MRRPPEGLNAVHGRLDHELAMAKSGNSAIVSVARARLAVADDHATGPCADSVAEF